LNAAHAWLGPWLLAGSEHSASTLLLQLLLANALLSVVLAALALAVRPANRRDRWQRDYLTLLGIGLLMPVVGPVLVVLAMILFNRLSGRHDPTEAQQLATSPFVPERARALGDFGVGGAIYGLKSGRLDTDKSIRALMLLEQQRSAHTSQVLFETLGHPDESVRLTAAGLLDRRESRLLQMIRRVEKALEAIPPSEPVRAGELHLEAAQLNAEMLYLRLAREGMAKMYVDRWGHHLDVAQDSYGDRPEWLISKARWLEKSHLSGSSELYQRAFEAGAAPASVLPYLAERYWAIYDYDRLRRLADAGDLFSGLPIAGIIRRRWGTST
jgi:hypothetical protein